MKHLWFTLAIACLALSSTARADVWGRLIPNTSVARAQEKIEPMPDLNGHKPAILAPAPVQAPMVQNDGYPFVDRCGASKSGCCANVWDGYAGSCGCGIGRGLFAHSIRGGGLLHGHGCKSCSSPCSNSCGCGGFGNFNSFAGGIAYGGCGCGNARGLGWHGCGLHTLAACGKHHFHNLRRACGLGCDSGCASCADSIGCNSCNGKSHGHEAGEGKNMGPPTPPGESTLVPDKVQDAPPPTPEKSAFRPTLPSTYRRSPLGF